MGVLLEEQSFREPLEFTHYDAWACDPRGLDVNTSEVATELLKVVTAWEETLGCDIGGWVNDRFDSYLEALIVLGFDALMELFVIRILRNDYDVYMGSDFIEIYA